LVPALNAALVQLPRFAQRHVVEVEILAVEGRTIIGESDPIAHDDGFGTLYFGARSFTQSNPLGNLALLEDLVAQLGAARVEDALELYAGHGNFTRVLARHAKRVVAIEGDQSAGALARLALPAVDHRTEPVEAAAPSLAEAGLRFDVALADPPRAGMPAPVLNALSALTDRLLYVSCDVGTFARDAARLGELGLGLVSVRLFDFYPQTPHAEVLGVFERV
jgi:23S rRNA (uracil1939-C5)-methyltransferase